MAQSSLATFGPGFFFSEVARYLFDLLSIPVLFERLTVFGGGRAVLVAFLGEPGGPTTLPQVIRAAPPSSFQVPFRLSSMRWPVAEPSSASVMAISLPSVSVVLYLPTKSLAAKANPCKAR